MRIRAALSIASSLALLLMAGTGCVTSLSEAEVKDRLEAAASDLRLRSARVMPIYAETRLVAQALLMEARHDPEAGLSLGLGRRIAVAAKRRQTVVVGGPYPALSDRVLRNALELNHEQGLTGLNLVLVSPDSPSRELSNAARQTRARLIHRSLP